jgi:hypothetical protein
VAGKTTTGAEASSDFGALRGAEAPLFHGAARSFPFHKGVLFRRGLLAAPFLFMEKNNDNSGREPIDIDGREDKVKSNVKGVGPFGGAQGKQECPTHTNQSHRGQMEVIELQAVADDNTKRTGEVIEAAFLAKVCKLRIPVCKPWGDSERYDFVVDWGKGFWSVQVKAGSKGKGSIYRARAGREGKVFTKDDMDFVVVHIVPEDLWYVVPVEIAEGLTTLWFNPRSRRARFEKYREAWCLLDCGQNERGRVDIPQRCRSEEVKVRCAACPLQQNLSSQNLTSPVKIRPR